MSETTVTRDAETVRADIGNVEPAKAALDRILDRIEFERATNERQRETYLARIAELETWEIRNADRVIEQKNTEIEGLRFAAENAHQDIEQLRQERDFVAGQRDRHLQAVEELVRDLGRLTAEAEGWRVEALRVHKTLQAEVTRLQQELIQLADPEIYDLDARAMRVAARRAVYGEVST